METMRSERTRTDTRQRLLEAAGEVFAERGFRAATVREICQRAKANLAAVNYHFGDKEHLYAAVLQYTFRYARQKYFHPTLGLSADATPEARLRAFICSFLFRLLDEGLPAWHGKLMAREMAEPT
jgi:TetR/AcrR family transcriptional regulator, regulator of cefoperazone and chloramphenicol sensitivity